MRDEAIKQLHLAINAINTIDKLVEGNLLNDFSKTIKALEELNGAFNTLHATLKRVKDFKYSLSEEISNFIESLKKVIKKLENGLEKNDEENSLLQKPAASLNAKFFKTQPSNPVISKDMTDQLARYMQSYLNRFGSFTKPDILVFDQNKLQQLTSEAGLYGFAAKEMNRNGNCFYLSISDQLKLNPKAPQYTHTELRDLAYKNLKRNQNFYKNYIAGDVSRFIEKSKKDTVWAEDIMPLIMARELNYNIVIINSDGSAPIILKRNNDEDKILYVGYEVGVHYNSLVPKIQGVEGVKRNIKELFKNTPIDTFDEKVFQQSSDKKEEVLPNIKYDEDFKKEQQKTASPYVKNSLLGNSNTQLRSEIGSAKNPKGAGQTVTLERKRD